MKYSPGPWKAKAASDTAHGILVIGADGRKIVNCGNVNNPMRWANARLIAASPRMFEALLGLLEVCHCKNGCAPDDMTCASNVARAALIDAGWEPEERK